MEKAPNSKLVTEPDIRPLSETESAGNSNPNSNPDVDEGGCSDCDVDQLELMLLNRLESLYKEALTKLVALGYEEEVALNALLRNGHCYGGMDVLTNILHNTLAYLNRDSGDNNGNSGDSDLVFVDLRQLEEYSLAAMVCLLQHLNPNLSKGEAMWCLFRSDLHVGRASGMENPASPSPSNDGCINPAASNMDSFTKNSDVVAPALCRFHGGRGFGDGGTSGVPVKGSRFYAPEMPLRTKIECPKRYNLTPRVKSLLKRNVAMFAAGLRANSKQFQPQAQPSLSPFSSGDSSTAIGLGSEGQVAQNDAHRNSKNQDSVSSVLSKFRDLNLDENINVPDDQKDEMVLGLINQIKDLERQVKERKEWAHEKAIQAAKKLGGDLAQLKILRAEREENHRLKMGKQNVEDATMKRLSEMENALRKASGQVDRANGAVRRLETENAEIRAEMEASKLSASESVAACLEVAKREKRCLKKLLTWEKQKSKLQEEIEAEKEKIALLKKQLGQIKGAQKEAEEKWRQAQKAKELALAEVEEERRLKEATEASNKRKLEVLRQKLEMDFQRHKDDHQRLEQELSRLKLSAQPTQTLHQSKRKSRGAKAKGGSSAKLHHELHKEDDSSANKATGDRECLICMKDEVSVVFLPCAHQVLCAKCNDNYGKKGKATCPCCQVPIEQRIRVFGASS